MTHTVTLIPGDGTGPELAAALETVIAATGVPIEWERRDAGVDVINIMQPQLFDLPELGRRFAGRITFECYPDMQKTLPTGDRQIIHADIAKQLRCLATPSGGYIAMWLDPYYHKSECDVDDPALATFITDTYRELDPYASSSRGSLNASLRGA